MIIAKSFPAALLVLMLCSAPLCARYVVDGVIEGSLCTSYIIFSTCHMVRVDAVKQGSDQLFTIKEEFDDVTEYNEAIGRCFVRLEYSKSWLSWGWRKAFGPTFFTKKSGGEYEQIDPEYVTFKCKKQN